MKQKSRFITRHHLIPKERQKNKTHSVDHATIHFDTVLKLWNDKHDYWHRVFGNLTLDEVIALLQRIRSIKAKVVPMKKLKKKTA